MPPRAYASTVPQTWGVICVVVASGVISALQVGKTAIATPMLQSEWGLGLAAIGWLTGIFSVLGLVGGIPAGAWVSNGGDRRIMIIGLGLLSAGTIMGAMAPGYVVLLAARFLEGTGFLLVTVAAPAVLNRVVRGEHRDFALALWSCFMPAGMGLAMLIGPLFSGWRSLWWGNAGLLVAAIATTLAIVPAASGGPTDSARSIASDALRVLTGRQPVLLAACFTFYSLVFFALFSFLPVLLMQQMEVEHGMAGFLSALASGVNIIGNLGAGYLLARGASRRLLLAGSYLIMGLAGIGIFSDVLGPLPVFVLCVLFSAVGGLIPATLISSAPLLAPSAGLAPVVIGLLMQGSNLGQIIGSVAVGVAIGAYGWVAASVIVPATVLLAILSALAISFDDRRAQ
ncbi:putative MFS family arabinose efflux permease [Neorhizobium sp. R1-B]|uniref:MFS transporter n=1 Tax=Neorhizobium sp. R1-B TaxID=2485162 RepID=UPI0010669A4C|nr:MFS transporter [Neorhizobium sp. R1-B]TDX79699.1 putative MFS family arabinose efflux permease [Neorhizobium sp. R1-B]